MFIALLRHELRDYRYCCADYEDVHRLYWMFKCHGFKMQVVDLDGTFYDIRLSGRAGLAPGAQTLIAI